MKLGKRFSKIGNIATIRLRNKCAMTDYVHTELVSVSCGLNPSPAFQAPSAQGRQGHTHRTALRFPLSPQVARGKIRSFENMKENIFTDKVYPLFTTHHSLKRPAFTLAEVLITLGIIGVVAALTMPSLIQNYKEKATVTKLKKMYSILEQGVQQMVTDEGTVDMWADNENNRAQILKELLPKYFHVIKKCNFDESHANCKIIKYKNRFTTSISEFRYNYGVYYLKDGSILYIYTLGPCYQDKNLNKGVPDAPNVHHGSYISMCAGIYVDINGEQGPNVLDKDLFLFWLAIDGVVPSGGSKETVWTETFNEQCLGKKYQNNLSTRCASWVINNENMDYLHCDNLDWHGKTSCKSKF